MELTEQEMGILDFERGWWLEGGSKQAAIRDRFGLSATRYYQLLGVVIDDQAALDYDPLLVRRLRRTRLERRRVRHGGRPIEERTRP
jgi:hypothetical protein